jgi:hypothetical protein
MPIGNPLNQEQPRSFLIVRRVRQLTDIAAALRSRLQSAPHSRCDRCQWSGR